MQVTYDLKINEINQNFLIENMNIKMEDKALAKAIKEGLKSESISKEEFLKALSAN